MKLGTNINVNGNELLNAVMHPSDTVPNGLQEGQIFFNKQTSHLMVFDGLEWKTIGSDEVSVSWEDIKDKPEDIVYIGYLDDYVTEEEMYPLLEKLATTIRENQSLIEDIYSGFYNKEEVNKLLASLATIKIEVYDELPLKGKSNVIYLIPKGPDTENSYYEYIWVNDEYELIGNTDVDLTDYATKEYVDNALEKYATLETLEGEIDGVTEWSIKGFELLDKRINEIKPDEIIVKRTGESIALNDSSDNPLVNLKVFGKSWQDGIPTPDNPQEIHSVDSPTVELANINLINHDDLVYGYYYDKDGSYSGDWATTLYCVKPLRLFKGSYNIRSKYKIYSIWIDDKLIKLDNYNDTYYELKITKNISTIKISFRNVEEDNVTDLWANVSIFDIKDSNKMLPYTKPQNLTIPYELNGIKVDSGGNFTDEHGQEWVCDYVDFDRGVFVKRVQKFTYEDIERTTTEEAGKGTFQLTIFFKGLDVFILQNYDITTVVSNIFEGVPNITLWSSSKTVITGWWNKNIIKPYINGDLIQELVDNPIKYLEKHNFYSVCILEKAQEIPLSDKELEAYKQLRTLYPYTTILNSQGAGMEVEYKADTKNYIDNKKYEVPITPSTSVEWRDVKNKPTNFAYKEDLSELATEKELKKFVSSTNAALDSKVNGQELQSVVNMSNQMYAELMDRKADKSDVPTKVSQLRNDMDYTNQTDYQELVNTFNSSLDMLNRNKVDKATRINGKTLDKDIVIDKVEYAQKDNLGNVISDTYIKRDDIVYADGNSINGNTQGLIANDDSQETKRRNWDVLTSFTNIDKVNIDNGKYFIEPYTNDSIVCSLQGNNSFLDFDLVMDRNIPIFDCGDNITLSNFETRYGTDLQFAEFKSKRNITIPYDMFLIKIRKSNNVLISNITVQNALTRCCVRIRESNNVKVLNSSFSWYVESGVGCVDSCKNIVVENCEFKHYISYEENYYCYGFSTGFSDYFNGTLKFNAIPINITVNNCYFEDSTWEGCDTHGGINVKFSNLNFRNVKTAITAYGDRRVFKHIDNRAPFGTNIIENINIINSSRWRDGLDYNTRGNHCTMLLTGYGGLSNLLVRNVKIANPVSFRRGCVQCDYSKNVTLENFDITFSKRLRSGNNPLLDVYSATNLVIDKWDVKDFIDEPTGILHFYGCKYTVRDSQFYKANVNSEYPSFAIYELDGSHITSSNVSHNTSKLVGHDNRESYVYEDGQTIMDSSYIRATDRYYIAKSEGYGLYSPFELNNTVYNCIVDGNKVVLNRARPICCCGSAIVFANKEKYICVDQYYDIEARKHIMIIDRDYYGDNETTVSVVKSDGPDGSASITDETVFYVSKRVKQIYRKAGWEG